MAKGLNCLYKYPSSLQVRYYDNNSCLVTNHASTLGRCKRNEWWQPYRSIRLIQTFSATWFLSSASISRMCS